MGGFTRTGGWLPVELDGESRKDMARMLLPPRASPSREVLGTGCVVLTQNVNRGMPVFGRKKSPISRVAVAPAFENRAP